MLPDSGAREPRSQRSPAWSTRGAAGMSHRTTLVRRRERPSGQRCEGTAAQIQCCSLTPRPEAGESKHQTGNGKPVAPLTKPVAHLSICRPEPPPEGLRTARGRAGARRCTTLGEQQAEGRNCTFASASTARSSFRKLVTGTRASRNAEATHRETANTPSSDTEARRRASLCRHSRARPIL